MRRLLIPITWLALGLAVFPRPVHAQSADPSETFYDAYTANEQGEALEGTGDVKQALAKFRYAASLLEQLSRENPDWRSEIVEYRKKRISENIVQAQQQLGEAPSQTPAPESANANPAAQPPEGELPQKDDFTPNGPDIANVSPTPSEDNPGARAKLEQLQDDLKKSQEKLKTVEAEKEDMATRLSDTLQQLDKSKGHEAELKANLKQAQATASNAAPGPAQPANGQKDLEDKISQLQTSLKQSQDAYNNLVAGQTQQANGQKDLQAKISQLQSALEQAQADRDAADVNSNELGRRAVKARDDEQAEATERDAANAKEKDLETKYAGAQKAVAELADAKKQIAGLTEQLDAANSHASDLDKKFADASQTAAKLAEAQKMIASLQQDKASSAKDAAEFNDKLADEQKQIADIAKDRDAAHAEVTDLNAKLADEQKQVVTISRDRDAAHAEVTDLNGKLDDAQKEIASVRTDRDKIASERDQALVDLGKARDAEKKVDQLLAENATLTQQLSDAENTIHNFKSGNPQKDQQIADLKQQVNETKVMLTATQKQRDDTQSTLNQLQTEFDKTTAELTALKTSTASPDEKKTLTDENTLLRGIVLRQLKEQAHRDQADKLVLSQVAKLQDKSDSLIQAIDFLDQPVTPLTDQEKALFKDSELKVADVNPTPAPAAADDSAAASLSIAAPKPEGSDRPGNNPTPQPVSNDVDKLKDALNNLSNPDNSSMADAGANATPVPEAAPSATPMEVAKLEQPDAITKLETATPTPTPAAEESEASKSTASITVPDALLDDARTAKDQFERGDYRESEKTYEKMLASAPNNVYILSNLGVVYFRDSKWDQAEESLKKAIAVAPEDVFSHCTLGIVYYQQHKFDEAINELTKALAINPKYAVAHNYLGITASQKGWQEAALKELQTAVEIDPNYGDACFNLAVLYAMQKPPNKDMARKYYEHAKDLGAEPDAGLEELLK